MNDAQDFTKLASVTLPECITMLVTNWNIKSIYVCIIEADGKFKICVMGDSEITIFATKEGKIMALAMKG